MAKKHKRKAGLGITRFDVAATLDTREALVGYLVAALETDDAAYIAKAIGTATRVVGVARIAKKSGLSRENLYRSLDGETKPEFDTIVRVLSALGVGLTARSLSAKH